MKRSNYILLFILFVLLSFKSFGQSADISFTYQSTVQSDGLDYSSFYSHTYTQSEYQAEGSPINWRVKISGYITGLSATNIEGAVEVYKNNSWITGDGYSYPGGGYYESWISVRPGDVISVRARVMSSEGSTQTGTTITCEVVSNATPD